MRYSFAVSDTTSVMELVPGIGESTTVVGDVELAREIGAKSADVAERFSAAVIAKDYALAHSLCATEIKAKTTADQLAEILAQQDEDWDGVPIEARTERVQWVYAHEDGRNRKNSDHEWPGATPKPNKRSMLRMWWTTEKTDGRDYGRPVDFWISEDEEGYKVSKFMPVRS
jgi:hypothetical protein